MPHHEKTIIVSEADLDELQHVNNVRYLQWIQDISKEHWQILVAAEDQKAMIWVVMRHEIDYKNAAVIGDELRIKTHINSSRGATSVRVVEMVNTKTDQLVVRSRTKWCLLSSITNKPIRIPENIIAIFSTD
ncbi:acyl-CoA thioesterase [Aggregatimonas sangjinii]|uniref:Acyl-CoA thioesterase n=1 Tax=Aggregatimonas sangjinii TaxID=2583587 RepID=A0A5B7ST95_9FLAO|nr:acyl-ACP thioesterase domain-containing protein [Aggregatimonas sangjinii]QCX00228.1 acyl-CoA thioesterase [Aggregatimonas sangjinii]